MNLTMARIAQLKAVLEMMEGLEILMFQGSKSYYSENDRFLNSENVAITGKAFGFQGPFFLLFFPGVLSLDPAGTQTDGPTPLPPMVGTTPGLRERYYKPTTKFF